MGKKPLAEDIQNKYYFVDHRRLVLEDNFIEREVYDDIDKIIAWIKANGIQNLNPLKCYKKGEQYVVRRGSRRNKAIQIMAAASGEIMMVPIILIKKGDSLERQYFEQATENEGSPYTPWEKAKVLKRARNEFGWSEKKMIEESGWSGTYIKRLLSLADAPERLVQLVRSGKMTATMAMDKIAEADSRQDPNILTELIEMGEKAKIPAPDPELFAEQPAAPSRRIKPTDLPKPLSFKKVDKLVAKVDEKNLSGEKLEVYKFVQRWTAGAMSEEDFNEYFRIL